MRRFKTAEELAAEAREELERRGVYDYRRTPYDYKRIIAVYGRQSTKEQAVKRRESAQEQAIDLMNYALELGWPDDKRLLFIEGKLADGTQKNASGRLRIDQRPSLQSLVEYIQRDEVSAVLVRTVDRLFRAESAVQPAIFADICRQHHTIVITYRGIYDFNNSARDDESRFIDEAKRGGAYIQEHILGTMIGALRRKALRGEYKGGTVPSGLMLDESRKFFVSNPYWQPVIVRLFRRYRELDGDLSALRREVVGKPIFCELPDDIRERTAGTNLVPVVGGYTVRSHLGLINILTNPAYIGHMVYDGQIVKYNAHPAIVDEQDFWYAFNRLSRFTPEGEPIVRQSKYAVRYTHKDTPPRDMLLSGVRPDGRPTIESHQGGVHILQKTHPTAKSSDAAYEIRNAEKQCPGAAIQASKLDRLVIERVHFRLQAMPRSSTEYEEDEDKGDIETAAMILRERLRHVIEETRQQIRKGVVSVDKAIAEARSHIRRIERRLDVAEDTMDDADLRESYATLKSLRVQLADLEKKKDSAAKAEQELQAAYADVENIRKEWETIPIERERRIVKLVTRAIYLDEPAQGWLRLTIEWNPVFGHTIADVAYIWRASGKTWTKQEDAVLTECYRTASRQELQERLPARSWQAIVGRASMRRLGARQATKDNYRLPTNVSLEDIEIMQQYGLEQEQEGQRLWWQIVDMGNLNSIMAVRPLLKG